MRAEDFNVHANLHFEPEKGLVKLGSNRMVVMGTEAVGALFQELINIGENTTAQVVMRRAGEVNGRQRAQTVKTDFQPSDKMQWLAFGPALHAGEGIGVPKLTHLEYNGSDKFHLEVEFQNSYLAEQYLKVIGPSTEPVCWMIAGYIAGYCSEVFDLKLICRETTCAAKGDAVCTFVCKPLDDWM